MIEQRNTVRFEPLGDEEEVGIESYEGVVSNVSEGGICVIVTRDIELEVGQQVVVNYLGHSAQALVRNITYDMLTAGYGLEWIQPLPNELQALLP